MSSTPSSPADLDESTVIEAGSGSSPDDRSVESIERVASQGAIEGRPVGRYVVLERIGEGGMGVVLRAYDPKLQREVALKMVRPGKSRRSGSAPPEARILREAQAMARLSHPNVLPVFDVESTPTGLFIAMEYVRGQTLRTWLFEARPTRDVLDAFCRAGEGMQAAHEAGIIHRDFKPANVLLGEDGRIRVMDFGLARGQENSETFGSESSDGALSMELTEAGLVVGTPPYMAPEQHVAGEVDGRSDQYAFCVSLYEALYRERPFTEKRLDALRRAKGRGLPERPPSDSGVPRWIYPILRRGLSPSPDERYGAMSELITELRRDPAQSRRRRLTAIASVATVGAAAYGWIVSTSPDELCGGARDKLAGAWDETVKSDVQQAFAATGKAYAASTWPRLATFVDGWSDQWVAGHRDACEATNVRGEQSPALMDQRMRCLDEGLRALRAASEIWAQADPKTVERAISMAATLPDPSRCADLDALAQDVVPPPSDLVVSVDELEVSLAEARALSASGKYPEALERAEVVLATARQLEYPPVLVKALDLTAQLRVHKGENDKALAELEEGLKLALESRYDAGVISAYEHIIAVQVALGNYGEADRVGETVLAWHKRVGSDPLAKSGTLLRVADIAEAKGDIVRAIELIEDVVAVRTRELGDDSPSVAAAMKANAQYLYLNGEFDRALALSERALDVTRRAYGDEHPLTATALTTRAAILRDLGKLAESREDYEQGVAVLERAFGPDNHQLAAALNNLSAVMDSQEEHDEALKVQRRAIAIWERSDSKANPNLGLLYVNLANPLQALGRNEEAARALLKAVQILETALGSEHLQVAMALANLADVYRATDRNEDAVASLQRALAIFESQPEPNHYNVGMVYGSLALTERGLGRYEDSIGHYLQANEHFESSVGREHAHVAQNVAGMAWAEVSLQRYEAAAAHAQEAIEIFEAVSAEEWRGTLGGAHHVYAIAKWELGNDREAARASAQRAAELFEQTERADDLEEVERWISEHYGGG